MVVYFDLKDQDGQPAGFSSSKVAFIQTHPVNPKLTLVFLLGQHAPVTIKMGHSELREVLAVAED